MPVLDLYALSLLARLVLGVLFLLSAVAKIRSSHAISAQGIEKYSFGLLDSNTASIVALVLPFVEILLATFLITDIGFKTTPFLAVGLLLTFTGPMAVHVAKGHRISCNCFGSESSEIGLGTLIRNLVLILIGLMLVTLPPTMSRLMTITEVIALLMTTASLCTVLLAMGEIDILFQTMRPV